MSDFFATPETDAAARMETGGTDECPPMEVVDVKLCKQMEWQRNYARRMAEQWRDYALDEGPRPDEVFMWDSAVHLSEANDPDNPRDQ